MGKPSTTPVALDRGQPTVRLRPTRIAAILAIVAGGLLVAGLVSAWVEHVLGYDEAYGLVPLFGLDVETSVPTFFMTALLLAVSVLLVLSGRVDRATARIGPRRWYALGAIALLLAVDEAASIHELLIRPGQELFGASGLLYFAWVVPGLAFVAVALAFNWVFFSRMPRRTRQFLLAAGAVYVSGALGVEAVGGAYADANGQNSLAYGGIVALEEGLEMGGLILAISGLLLHLSHALGATPLGLMFGASRTPRSLAEDAPAGQSSGGRFAPGSGGSPGAGPTRATGENPPVRAHR